MLWKEPLYDYVQARNQAEVNYDWTLLRSAVDDERALLRMRLQLERKQRSHLGRGLAPVRSETRLSVRRIERTEGGIAVDVRLHTVLQSRIRGLPLSEEQMETETISLKPGSSGQWRVTGVSRPSSEGYDTPTTPLLGALSPAANQRQPAAPLINREMIAPPNERKSQPRYNRELARRYAERWWNGHNPQFIHFDVDCSNYVSQCILAGGIPMEETNRRETGWWYRGRIGGRELWSYSWAVAHALQVYLGGKRAWGLRAEAVDSPKKLAVGDVISYSWEGDGRYGHSTVVTGFDPNGMPLVNAHTVNSRNRYWDYSDSYAWTERTKYRFFHIQDGLSDRSNDASSIIHV